jgi:hypothetical protein
MGKEVVYCFRCGKRLLEEEFTEGKAVALPRHSGCRACLSQIRDQLSIEEQQILDRPPTAPEPKSAPTKPPTIRRHPTQRFVSDSKRGSPVLLVVGAIIAVGALILIMMPSRPPRRVTTETPRPEIVAETPQAPPAPVLPPTSDPFEAARAYAKMHPEDLTGIIRRFRAVNQKPDAAVSQEIVRYEEALLRAMSDREKKIDASSSPLLSERKFREYFALLQIERSSFDEDAWRQGIDRRVDNAKRGLLDEVSKLSPQAIDKAKEGKLQEAIALLGPMQKLDLDFLNAELDALQRRLESEPVAVRVEPTANQKAAFDKACREAMEAAARRDYQAARQSLERVRELESTLLAERWREWVELVRRAEEFYSAVRQRSVPYDAELSWYESNSSRTGKGTVIYSDGTVLHWREPNMTRDARIIPWAIVATDSFVALGRGHELELGAFLAFEGKLDRAKKEFPKGGPYPDAPSTIKKIYPPVKTARLSESPEYKNREKEALKLFQEAERLYPKEPIRAIEKLNELQKTFGDTEVAESKKDKIKKMLDYGREYVWTPASLKKFTEGWKPANAPKDPRMFLYFDKNIDAAKLKKVWLDTDWIELEINALPNTRYWLHVHLGGCCQEATRFSLQGDSLDVVFIREGGREEKSSVHTGTGAGFTLKGHAHAGTHADHGAPSTWGWITFNPIEFGAPGVKKIRLYPACKGSSVSHVVLSAAKYKGVPPMTLKELSD